MIYSGNRPTKEQIREINNLVGKPPGFLERIKSGGVGSPKLVISKFSPDLKEKFGLNVDRKFLNIELRESGIIIYFRNHINDYIWPIPYYRLTLYQSETFNIHAEGKFINLDLDKSHKGARTFIRKMMDKRAIKLDEGAIT